MSDMRKMIAVAAFSPVMLTSAALAQDAEWDWQRASSESGAFSVEVPCNEGEVAAFTRRMQSNTPQMGNDGVACMQGGAVFSAGRIAVPEGQPLPQPMFDIIAEAIAASGANPGVETSRTEVAGRRAMFSRQMTNGNVAQTGIIELDERSYLLLMAGGIAAQGPVPDDIAENIDTFFASLEIAS